MDFLDWMLDPAAWVSLLTLSVLEIVLGIDNIIVISILSDKLPPQKRPRARFVGLSLALFTRIALLTTISYIAGMTGKWLFLGQHGFSGRDLVLIMGGLFLLYKSIKEIADKFRSIAEEHNRKVRPSFWAIILQIILLDIVFSLDSVITAVGLSNQLPIMILAVVLAVLIMMLVSGSIAEVIHRYPSLKLLALSFLVLVGGVLVVEGFEVEVDKTWMYASMGFSTAVEALNIAYRRAVRQPKGKPNDAVEANPT